MRTSNKILAVVIIVCSIMLIERDEQLKAEYLSGTFRDPYRDCLPVSQPELNAVAKNGPINIDITPMGATHIYVLKGPFRILMEKSLKGEVAFSATNGGLTITEHRDTTKEHADEQAFRAAIYVWIPNVAAVSVRNETVSGNIPAAYVHSYSETTIRGFDLDSLHILMDESAGVALDSNHIRALCAESGSGKVRQPSLFIGASNTIASAYVTIPNKGSLELQTNIPDPHYHLGDSTVVQLSLGAAGILNRK